MQMHINTTKLAMLSTGDGAPFVWAHGLMSSMAAEDALGWFAWDDLPAGIRLIRYDARGHGTSGPPARPEDCAWRQLGRDMLAIADAAGADRFIAGGASMGSVTAIHAALQAPERIKGLILMIPPLLWEARSAQRQLYRRAAALGTVLGGRAMDKLMSRNMTPSMPDWLPQQQADDGTRAPSGMAAMSRATLSDVFHGAALSDLPPRASLAAIANIPTLIVGWAGDRMHPLASAEQLHQLLPQSTLFIASGLEEFGSIAPIIKEFAARHA